MTIADLPGKPRSRQRALLPRAAALAAALLAALLCPPAAFAQDDPFGWFTHLFQSAPSAAPSHVMKKKKPAADRGASRRFAPQPRQEARPRPRERQPAESVAAKPAIPAIAPGYFVAVLGDSLGQMLAQGLTEAFAGRPDIAIMREAKADTGLVRDDFYDWNKAAQALLASGRRVDFAVMMIGSNDRQALRDGAGGVLEPLSPQWKEAYAARIDAIAAPFRDKNIPLVWVGLPVLKSERLSADAIAINELYRQHAAKMGATYVDVWEAFANDAGDYSPAGPDVNGQIVKLRAADGIHFTAAGALKLANFVEPEIRRAYERTRQQESPDAPAISAPAEAALPPADAAPAGGPPATAPAPAPPPPKPIAGPVLPLTGPVRAPGGELAARAAPLRPTAERQQAAEPKPGRVDDFTWPRP